MRWDVYNRDNFTCQYCGKGAHQNLLELDHIVPLSQGGRDHRDNLITACFECNRGKSKKLLNKKLVSKQLHLISVNSCDMEQGVTKERMTVHLTKRLIARLKNAVYWTPGLTLAELAEHGLGAEITKLEKKNGGAYKPMPSDTWLKGGRPLGSSL